MTPKEAAETMKIEAEAMARMIRSMRARKSSDFLNKDLLNWLCMALQQHVDFKNSMADLIIILGDSNPNFQIIPTIQTDANQTLQNSKVFNLEAPPFDSDFWAGLGDV